MVGRKQNKGVSLMLEIGGDDAQLVKESLPYLLPKQ